MKKAKKILALLMCAVLLVGASIAGTVAYLTSQDEVTNTFTVGKVEIKLEEYDVDEQTGKKNATVVEGLANLELVPGREIEKNPFITVDANSETCWLFVKIVNNLGNAVTINGLTENGWAAVAGHEGYYQYAYAVGANTVVPVFNSVTCDTDNTYDTLNGITNKNIVVTAFAVQSEGISQADAWTALAGQLSLT